MKSIAKNSLVVAFIIFFSASASGQDFKGRFREAKDAFRAGAYTRSMDLFKGLIAYDQNNPYSEYASYYYGLSALKLGFTTVAKDIFLQIRKLHPKWEQIDEVNFVLAKIYFDQREYFQGMLILKGIRSSSVTADLPSMKRFYLSRIADPETLRMMLEEYPQEKEAAWALAKAISMQPFPQRDLKFLDSLLIKFHLDKNKFASDTTLISLRKDRYSVSLLLPFLANSLDPMPVKKRNQYVLDLYEGMKMAADTLETQDTHVDLRAYDIERSPEVTRSVLQMEELRGSDLLVGPLFQEQVRQVLEFSEKNKINIINPVSNNAEFIGSNPFAMLYQPAYETLGVRSAEILAGRAKNKNCIVYFSDSPRDSAKAFSFMKKAIELGMTIVLAEEITKETSAKIFSTLATATEFDEFKNPKEFAMKLDSIGSIYVATDDPVIFTKVISGVETRGDSILIVGNENWISDENSSVDFSVLERLHVLLEAPNIAPAHDQSYLNFRTRYIRKHGILPSGYAQMGYEFMLFVGRSLKQYGVYFQIGLNQEREIPGLGIRYDFRNSRDNQHVPFVYFHSGELVRVPN